VAAATRDRVTWLTYALLGLWGYFLYGFGPTVPYLVDDLHLSHALGGLHSTVTASAAVVIGLAGQRPAARWGRRRLLWGGALLLSLGTLLYCSVRVVPLTLTAALVFGLGGALIVNNVNAVVMDHHGERGPAVLSEANAIAAGMGIAAPLVIGAAVAVGLGWRAGLLVTVVGVVVAYALLRSVQVPAEPERAEAAQQPGRVRLSRQFWLTWCVLVCTIGVEFCLSLWSTDLLRHRDGLPSWAATASWSVLLVGFTLSRVAGSRLAVSHGVDWLLLRALLVLALGFAVFWVTSSGAVAVLGLFVAGLGLGLQYPLTAARAIALAGGRTDLAAGRLSVAAGLAAGGAPFLLGALADGYGEHAAFLLVPVLVALALVGLVVSRPRAEVAGSAVEQLG
jgi:predicted MFS family arabinose efflux permease